MSVLIIDAASRAAHVAFLPTSGRARTAVVENGVAARLPAAAASVLDGARPDAIAAVVGPGGFTGLRAGLALAHGLAAGFGVPLAGVTVGEAIAAMLSNVTEPLWVVTDSRRDRVFIEAVPATASAFSLNELPAPTVPIALAGDGAALVMGRLPAGTARLLPVTHADAAAVAMVASRRLDGMVPMVPVAPLYVDPPEARARVSRPNPA